MTTLRRLNVLARSEYLIEKCILLLATIRVTTFNLQRLLCACSVPFFVIAHVRIVLRHFFAIIFVFLVLHYIELVVILGEIVLLLLYLTEIRVETLGYPMLVAFSRVEARFVDHLRGIKAFPSWLHLVSARNRGCRIFFSSIIQDLFDYLVQLHRVILWVLLLFKKSFVSFQGWCRLYFLYSYPIQVGRCIESIEINVVLGDVHDFRGLFCAASSCNQI